ncbi:MAG: tRNA lysidine(34) synthetase TilS [Candidatus Latescibacteria bacterium]|nr:tRNA lysidine(34) synthetase TilS [Candidatus Latescibacterota bacterium]NIM66413.1 tRNA lysidine(34) synthetase TilS [Candidatus Latescibacterota bacterium]NIO02892.1 tRNA lysidine(34) synthetase TilS [Candidatus Latescibacterota bacterium]NIO30027.1 tRNA lysidine(34) synthetase TilS [Candidatus Latescibacterota bacterium]NIO57642.1 tRNA lysidine(34) synthetase TilS [Candidatus Latescibacterota bacterium]
MILESKKRYSPRNPADPAEHARRLEETVKWFIVSEELIPKDALILAAVSGGQDSMAMLSILHRLSEELHFQLAVAHFDHSLRESSKLDRKVVEDFARSCALDVYAESEDVRSLAESAREPIEEAARKARYRFFLHTANEIGADRIATGHTKNDQVETVIMRFLRGSGVRGLAGIPTQRGKLIRPLIQLERNETLTYCNALNILFVTDPSNTDPQFFRNKIRLQLLPSLRKLHPSIDENILRVSENAKALITSIRERTGPLLKRHSRQVSENEWMLNVAKLSGLDETSLVILFGDLFAEVMQLDMDFTRSHYEQLVRFAKDSSVSGKKLSLPGLSAKREFENLIFTLQTKTSKPREPSPIDLTLPIPGQASAAGMIIKTEVHEESKLTGNSFQSVGDSAYFALDLISPPVTIRRPRPGDRMQPFGMRGSKKLSDIFIDKKIPGRERSRALVVSDASGILWLIGVTTSERGRIEKNTEKILKITIERE